MHLNKTNKHIINIMGEEGYLKKVGRGQILKYSNAVIIQRINHFRSLYYDVKKKLLNNFIKQNNNNFFVMKCHF